MSNEINNLPFTYIWVYVTKNDVENYGAIRNLFGIQNKNNPPAKEIIITKSLKCNNFTFIYLPKENEEIKIKYKNGLIEDNFGQELQLGNSFKLLFICSHLHKSEHGIDCLIYNNQQYKNLPTIIQDDFNGYWEELIENKVFISSITGTQLRKLCQYIK